MAAVAYSRKQVALFLVNRTGIVLAGEPKANTTYPSIINDVNNVTTSNKRVMKKS
jgi:hypothetical protein